MAGDLAIIAGAGQLPVALAKAHPQAMKFVFQGMAHNMGTAVIEHSFNALGALFQDLKAQGVSRVVLAGGMSRPNLDPRKFDSYMTRVAPHLLAAFQQGDDALLRFVISLFEDHDIAVIGAHHLLPELTADQGVLSGTIPDHAYADINRADHIMSTLSSLDIGQGIVVENGLTLGIETLQGTDALLNFVAQTDDHLRHLNRGILVKRPKLDQDLRVDMPTIGPDTIQAVARAGLSGIVISPNQVILVDRLAIIQLAKDLGLFVAALEIST